MKVLRIDSLIYGRGNMGCIINRARKNADEVSKPCAFSLSYTYSLGQFEYIFWFLAPGGGVSYVTKFTYFFIMSTFPRMKRSLLLYGIAPGNKSCSKLTTEELILIVGICRSCHFDQVQRPDSPNDPTKLLRQRFPDCIRNLKENSIIDRIKSGFHAPQNISRF